MRVLALDYGSARCGVAVSDPTGVLATPLEPVLKPGGREGMGQILALVRELEAERVVVGLPLSLSGGDSAQTREARDFAAVLEQRLGRRAGGALRRALHHRARAARWRGSDPPAAAPSEDSRAAAHLLSSWLERHADA